MAGDRPGRRGLSPWLVDTVVKLLDAGVSKNSIARLLGVDRATIRRIERDDHPVLRREVIRCPTCGALVEPPCVNCGLRLS